MALRHRHRKACPAGGGSATGSSFEETDRRFAADRANRPEVSEVENENEIVEHGVVVPESPLLLRRKKNPYGSVPGLDDDELADPDELEHQIVLEEFGPVLRLPERGRRRTFWPTVDEKGLIDGAFATVDFERVRGGGPDRLRGRIEELRAQLRDCMIMFSTIKAHLPGRAKYLVLKYLRMGVIDMDDIVNDDMRELARFYRRAERLREEIRQLRAARTKRLRNQLAALLA